MMVVTIVVAIHLSIKKLQYFIDCLSVLFCLLSLASADVIVTTYNIISKEVGVPEEMKKNKHAQEMPVSDRISVHFKFLMNLGKTATNRFFMYLMTEELCDSLKINKLKRMPWN